MINGNLIAQYEHKFPILELLWISLSQNVDDSIFACE